MRHVCWLFWPCKEEVWHPSACTVPSLESWFFPCIAVPRSPSERQHALCTPLSFSEEGSGKTNSVNAQISFVAKHCRTHLFCKVSELAFRFPFGDKGREWSGQMNSAHCHYAADSIPHGPAGRGFHSGATLTRVPGE